MRPERVRTIAAIWLIAATFCVGSPSGSAAEPQESTIARVQAYLDAGEFAPAIALARAADDRSDRDALYSRVAAAQAAAGETGSAIASSAEIGDDSLRTNTLARLAGAPIAAPGAAGGGTQADFDALIELITSTIAPESWNEGGGNGAIDEFPSGVYVDAQGVLGRLTAKQGRAKSARSPDEARRLSSFRLASIRGGDRSDARREFPLRKVSLPRLERAVQLRLAAGEPLDDSMLVLAGLERIQYVLVYPETGDLVLVGPAGDWTSDREGRIVSSATGRPVVRLDDLVVVMRHMLSHPDARFGCSITPTPRALERTQAFLDESRSQPIKAGRTDEWLEQIRATVGRQQIEVRGIDPRTRVARVLVEADYRMKLVGIDLEEGTPDVPSYLDLLEAEGGKSPPAMDVLRWWFTLDYDALVAASDRLAFEIRGQGVKVLSENELLEAEGRRVHTGKANPLNQQFAANFTRHFDDLSAKYPIYAELQNVFDLALVGALIQAEDLHGQIGWEFSCFGDPGAFPVAAAPAPTTVDTVANLRIVERTRVLGVVSGGVDVAPADFVTRDAIESDRQGRLASERSRSTPPPLSADAWWWD